MTSTSSERLVPGQVTAPCRGTATAREPLSPHRLHPATLLPQKHCPHGQDASAPTRDERRSTKNVTDRLPRGEQSKAAEPQAIDFRSTLPPAPPSLKSK